jgi:transposase InsO family protein
MAWVTTIGTGISGKMVRDMMLECVERRFNAVRAPEPVQWLADNGSAYTAGETVDFATALNLVACFTPVRSPESTDEFEQPLSASCATFLQRMGDRAAKSGAWR